MSTYRKFLTYIVCISMIVSTTGLSIAQATPLSTGEYLEYSRNQQHRDRVRDFLSRSDVVSILEGYGVNTVEAKERVSSLTDREAAELAKQIEDLPAGGDAVGTIVGAILIVFFVLLLTDILGLTKVYPFTRSYR